MRSVSVRPVIALAVAVMLPAVAAMAQPAPARPVPVSLRGRVVDADNDQPLRRAMVSLARGDIRGRAVLTDDEGRFVIDLPDQSSAIVTKSGYASTVVAPDRRTPGALEIRLRRGAVISGRVVEQGMPAIGARVIARRLDDASSPVPTYQAEVDDLGEYRIGGLPAGQYAVTAFSGGQVVRVTPGLGSDRDAVQGIVFGRVPVLPETSGRVAEGLAGQETADVDFRIAPPQVTPPQLTGAAVEFLKATESDPGAISGRVVTPSGQPVSGAMVMVSGNNQSRMVVADRNGEFDAGRFKEGDYRIETGKSGYLTPDFRPLPESQTALMVHVGGDTRVHDIDVVLERGGAIAGTIVDSVARVDRDGTFSLADVPAGDYVLQAIGERGPGVAPEFGSEYITVGDLDTPPLTVRTTPGATLDGRFVAEGRSPLPLRAQVLHAAPIDPDRSPPDGRGSEGLAVHDDGRFYLTGLYGSMRLTYPAPAGRYLKSVTIGGLDVTDRTFDFGFADDMFSDAEVVLSNAGARVSGSVTDASDKRATEFVVVAFSTSRTNWFSGSRHLERAVTGAKGSFDLDGLPPGEYYVAALDGLPQGDWQSPDSLDLMVQRAERVTLGEGQRRTMTLRLTRR